MGVAIDQGTKADLVGDAGAGDGLGEDADHDAWHGTRTLKSSARLS